MNSPDETDEHRQRRNYSLRQIGVRTLRLFAPYWKHFAFGFLLLTLQTAAVVAGPRLIKRAIDVDIAAKDYAGLKWTVGCYLIVHLTGMVLLYIMRNWLEWTGQQMMSGLRKRLSRHLIDLPLSFHDRTSPGELLSRVESDTQALRVLFTTTAVTLLGDVLLFGGMFTVMFVESPRLTIITACLLPILLGLMVVFQRKIHPIYVEVRRRNAKIAARLAEFLGSASILQAFARRRWAAAEFHRLTESKYRHQLGGDRLILFWFNLVAFLQTLTFAAILGFGGYWALSGLVTIGTLVMFIGYVRRFFEPLLRLSEQIAVIQRSFASAERIFSLLDESNPITDPETPTTPPPLEAAIAFENVWFSYSEEFANQNGQADADLSHEEWVLKDVSFTLPAGEVWAVVGPTGSGKTTLINLLLRFYEPQRGRILIDGVDLRELRQEDLRDLIGLVQQEIFLFPGDLVGNLTFRRAAANTRLPETIRRTGAQAVLDRLPAGAQTELAERGANLSLGERQLLSLTRALVRDPKLVILDEATSAIDPATEAALVETTRELITGRTGLVIAHRLATTRDCDRILVLRDGEIAEQGSHQELIAKRGLYSTLSELQGH